MAYPHSVRLTLPYGLGRLLPIVLISLAALGADVKPDKRLAARPIQPLYSVSVGVDGEIFPALANFASFQRAGNRELGTVTVTVRNPGGELVRNRIAVQITGWSDQEVQTVEVAAGASVALKFAPTFLPRLYANREIVAATAVVTATDMSGNPVFQGTLLVRLRAAGDMFWGSHFKFAPFIASWVTPHDPLVEQVLSRAKELVPGRRLPGYEGWKDQASQRQATYAQARAIYRALQRKGVSYVKSSLSFGSNGNISERVRLPRESLHHVSANCIDGVVLFASLFENLGMDPMIVLVPGHAYVGVREAEGSRNYLFIETSLTGRAGFDAAVTAADRGLARQKPADIIRIPISQARQAGIYPMPLPRRSGQSASLDPDSLP